MSKLNINRNIFLEREELLRFQEFMAESAVNQTFLSNTLNWGIIDTSGGSSPNDFKIIEGSTSGTVRIQYLSRALTESGLMIKQSPIDNVAVPNDSAWYWVKISHKYSSEEDGIVSITADGQLSGSGTYFTQVLRGQSTEVPVKIKFTNSINNTASYEVVDVTGDSTAILMGDDFTVESNLKYKVIGSISLGDTITSLQEEGLYFYDSCQIDLIAETVSDTEPAGKVQDEEFWIARVRNVTGTVTIEDKRTEYWEYYIRGVSDKLTSSNNLSDVASIEQARDNLDVYSTGEVDALVGADQIGWTTMTKGSIVSPTNYSIKASRVGKTISISGRAHINVGSPTQGSIIASLPISTIAEGMELTHTIWSQSNEISSGTSNKGCSFYVPPFSSVLNPNLQLILDVQDGVDTMGIVYIFVNITFNAI